MIRIGDLAAQTGLTTRVLRYYEQQGLLPAMRTHNGQQHYPETAADRVRTIRQLFAADLSSRAIATVLPCVDARESTKEVVDLLQSERARINRQIDDLLTARAELDAVIVIATEPNACGAPPVSPRTSTFSAVMVQHARPEPTKQSPLTPR